VVVADAADHGSMVIMPKPRAATEAKLLLRSPLKVIEE
jgi:hypothetical protein